MNRHLPVGATAPEGTVAVTMIASKESSPSLKPKPEEAHEISRRDALSFFASILSSSAILSAASLPTNARAQVTDETNAFAVSNSAYEYIMNPTKENEANATIINPSYSSSPTDEISVRIPISKMQNSPLGLELVDLEFRTNRRVYIKSVQPNSIATQYNIRPNYILVSVNGKSCERTDAKGAAQMISTQMKQTMNQQQDLVLVFRNDSFQSQIQDLSSTKEVTTQIAPAGDTTQRNTDGSIRIGQVTQQMDQRMTVSQLIPPKYCTKGAKVDDLLEISYTGSVLEDVGNLRLFDGSAIKINGQGVPGRGNDVSLFFVLGKQPFGQFPPGWDVGLYGMCVSERRRLVIPPVLAYGSQGLPRRGIPPNSTLVYDVTLVSINGLAIPQ